MFFINKTNIEIEKDSNQIFDIPFAKRTYPKKNNSQILKNIILNLLMNNLLNYERYIINWFL